MDQKYRTIFVHIEYISLVGGQNKQKFLVKFRLGFVNNQLKELWNLNPILSISTTFMVKNHYFSLSQGITEYFKRSVWEKSISHHAIRICTCDNFLHLHCSRTLCPSSSTAVQDKIVCLFCLPIPRYIHKVYGIYNPCLNPNFRTCICTEYKYDLKFPWPEPETLVPDFFFHDFSTTDFRTAYTTVKLFCTEIQDVSPHTTFSTLKRKEVYRYQLLVIPRPGSW